MERVRSFILEQDPDVLCLQELSFPANLWIPKGYRRVGLSISHHIYVRKGIKSRPLWFAVHHNAAKIGGIRIINVHGTWRKCMDRAWRQIKGRMKEPCLVVGDFNQTYISVADNLKVPMPKRGCYTFKNYTTGAQGDIDHCVTKGLAGVDCSVYDDGFAMSDHLPLVISI